MSDSEYGHEEYKADNDGLSIGNCKRLQERVEHGPHHWDADDVRQPWRYHYKCPGFETTHTVTVTDASGKAILTEPTDLRRYDLAEPKEAMGEAELTMILDARERGVELTEDEFFGRLAALNVAPEVCPYDSERCHEHLYELKYEDEDEED